MNDMWIIDDFTNLEMSGEDGGWTTAMFQFCRAINERQVAIGATPSKFLIGSGSAVAFPTMEQLKGVKLTGINSAYARNIAGIVASIKQLITFAGWTGGGGGLSSNFYMPAMNDITQWTIEDFNDAIGFNLLSESIFGPVSPDTEKFSRQVRTEYFTAIKNALDLLVYFTRFHQHILTYVQPENLRTPSGTTTVWQNHVHSGQPGATYPKTNPPQYTNMVDAWDNREYLIQRWPPEVGDDSISGWVPGLSSGASMEIGEHPITHVRRYESRHGQGGQGVITDVRYMDTGATVTGSVHDFAVQNTTPSTFDFGFADASGTLAADIPNQRVYLSGAPPSLTVLNYGDLAFEIPEVSPFSDELGYEIVNVWLKGSYICFDATPILTDKT